MTIDIQLRPIEAAKRLGIALSTFWKLAKTDPIFPTLTRIGRTTSVSAGLLDAYVQAKTGGRK